MPAKKKTTKRKPVVQASPSQTSGRFGRCSCCGTTLLELPTPPDEPTPGVCPTCGTDFNP